MMRIVKVLFNWWPTILGIILGCWLAGVLGGCTVYRQPINLSLYQAATTDGDEQMDDCSLWTTSELVCGMGMGI